jgi:hypothetical protein
LAELLSAFKDAADDASELKQRELNRLEHQRELSEYLDNVGSRMHNEDLEGDIERCWDALRATCMEQGSAIVPLTAVIEKLKPMLQSTFELGQEECQSEAFVASFIAGLFLTHRRMASISQQGEAVGDILIEDLWPTISSFAEVLDTVEALMAEDSDALDGQATGLDHRLEAIAERARLAEERETRRQAKVQAATAASLAEEATQPEDHEDGEVEPSVDDSYSLDAHDWLVE